VTEPRFVEVAVDAPGVAGGRTYTYAVPASLADLELGEAVMVEFGRRRAVGVVLADAPPPEMTAKPLLARVRSEGPLLGALWRRLARHVSEHYLAPPGMVVRAMLPPGTLERIELYAVAVTATPEPGDPWLAAVLDAGAEGIVVDALPPAASRATLLRTLRAHEADGRLRLEWRVQPPATRPRRRRWASLTQEGRAAAASLAAGERLPGRPLGQRQRALLAELAEAERGAARKGGSATGVESASAAAEPAARLAERHGSSAVSGLARRGLLELEVRVEERRPLAGRAGPTRGARPVGSALDAGQAAAVAALREAIEAGASRAFLLEGDTASGKTAVYAEAIAAALAVDRGALVLVPEIALAVPLLDRLQHDLGVEVAMLHSAMSDGERADEWRRIAAGAVRVVVGTRTAALSPPDPLGLVVVDEEHDPAYKADRTPRYQGRDVAIELGRLADAPVLLGSATPDIVTIGAVRAGTVARLPLRGRRSGAPVTVEVVDLRAELAEGNRGLLSDALAARLDALDRGAGDRAILLINRRGAASVVLCRDCGYVQICPECQRPLVFHAAVVALRCHHCGASAPVARRCPACESVRIRYLGGGTERVEQELQVRFPDLRVARLDRDIVERKGAATRVVDDFAAGATDVLVGTSLVAKGLDIPEVTLVGVVSADIALNLPDERAAERTWQLLTQAVGRAGRGDRPGHAVLQTYQPEHPAIVAVASSDARAFVDAELARRERVGSPPFGQLIKLTVALPQREAAIAAATEMVAQLRERATGLAARVEVLGPVPAYIAKRGGRWRFHVVLRGDDPAVVLGGDPGAPWSVDVDPEGLL
jgi:primosomal protein N' (replication factor Y)